jgi:hypothetical protein
MTETTPKLTPTVGKLACELKVGDVFINTWEQTDGTTGICLETVTEVTRNVMGEKEMTVRTVWQFGKDKIVGGHNYSGESTVKLRRHGYVTVL